MRLASLLLLLAAAASCGSSLGDPNQPDSPTTTTTRTVPTDADCVMFNPIACRLDVSKTSIGIDVHYPNTVFCQLQLLPTTDLASVFAVSDIAASWQVTMLDGARDQTILASEIHQGAVEYPLGTETLYLTRVTFTSKTSDTLATLVGGALGPDVSVFAVPVECPGRRPSP